MTTARGAARRRTAAATVRLVAGEALRSFARNRGLAAAATLAFYGFLALMPMLLLLVLALSLVLRSSGTALAELGAATRAVFPTVADSLLENLLAVAEGRAWGVVGVLLLLWSTTPLTGAIRGTLEHCFRVERQRPFWRSKAADLGAALALTGLFALLVVGNALGAALRARGPAAALPLAAALEPAAALLVTAAALLALYRVFGGRGAGAANLAAGAAVAAVLLAAMRPVFVLFLRLNPDYGYVFGSLKAVFLLIVWTYYSFAVILLGAEVAAALRRKEALLVRGAFTAASGSWHLPPLLLDRFVRDLDRDAVVFGDGEGGSEMFFVLEGDVALEKEGVELSRARPGDYFGEMSMLLESPRTATARVVSPEARLLAIPRESFDLLLRENPEVVQRMLRDMAARLRATSERVATPARR